MGSTLSVCGLGTSDDSVSSNQHVRAFEREKVMELLAHSDRTRSLSVSTDTSVASIISSSDKLIPDAFMPVDIQVVSQRRVRPASSSLMAAQSHYNGNVTPSTATKAFGSHNHNHYYSNSAQTHAAFQRYMTSSTAATATESMPPSSVAPVRKPRNVSGDASPVVNDASLRSRRRSGNHSHVAVRDLVKGC